MATKTKTSAITGTRNAEIIADLNGVLVDLIDLSLSAKQAHWNTQGPNFQGLHELFDVVTDEARLHYDEIAERVMALGGTAHGTLQDVSKHSSLPAFPTDEKKWDALTKAMHTRLVTVCGNLRELAASTEDDLATQDLYIEVIRGLEKRAWMLEAHAR
jgi:starvation-inducible DNA-binding protein